MKRIALSRTKRYIYGGKVYVAEQEYALNDALADVLLAHCDGRDIPYFRVVKGSKATEDEVEVEDSPPKAATKTKAAPKKKAASKKKAAAKPADDEPAVDV